MPEELPKPLYMALLKNTSSKKVKVSMTLSGWRSLLPSKTLTFEIEPTSNRNLSYPKADKPFCLKIEDDDGNELEIEDDDGNKLKEMKTYAILIVDKDCTKVTLDPAPKAIVSMEHGRRREQLAALAALDNYYHVLQIKEDATEQEIRLAYLRLAMLHHPDKNNNTIESNIAMQAVDEAYNCLNDSKLRELYDKMLAHSAGITSKKGIKALWKDKKRFYLFLGAILFCLIGISITAATAGLGLGLVILGGVLGGAMVGGGSQSIRYLLSQRAAVNGVETADLCWNAGTGAVLGGTVGGMAAGFSSLVSPLIANAIGQPILAGIANGVTVGGTGGILWGIEAVLADAFANGRWSGMDPKQIAFDLLKAILVGGVAGSAGGMLVGLKEGLSNHWGTAGTAADEIAGNIAGVFNGELRKFGRYAIKQALTLTGSAIKQGSDYGMQYYAELYRLLHQKIPAAVLALHPNLPDDIIDELAQDAIDFEMHSKQGRVLLINRGHFIARAIVIFRVGDEEQTMELENGKFEYLPQEAFDVEITFAILPFKVLIKKWNREKKRFCKPTEIERFRYVCAPQRTFIVDGTVGHAHVVEVLNEACERVEE